MIILDPGLGQKDNRLRVLKPVVITAASMSVLDPALRQEEN